MRTLRPLAVTSREEFARELERISVDEGCVDIFLDKQDSFLLKITDILTPAANIFKQTALSCGADVAVHREVITGKIERSDAIYMGTRRQLKRAALSLSGQPFGLAALEKQVSILLANLSRRPPVMELPAGRLSFDKPAVMGVLNVTPDSFSDGGQYLEPADACDRINQMLDQGADIIDVGAESTRPGSDPVSTPDQLARLKPVFDHLSGKKVIWSVDTTDTEVARIALDKGASVINDISGAADLSLCKLAGEYNAGYVLMHIQGDPKTMQQDPSYHDFNGQLFDFFTERIQAITETGFPAEKIIIDPGMGFGKRVQDNTAALRRLSELRAFGLPILVGASRKSFLGKLMGIEVQDRLEASLACAVISCINGAHLVRVHDVIETKKALSATSEILSCAGASHD